MYDKISFLAAILMVVFLFIPISARANVIINEIAWMGTGVSANDEWIELYNNSEQGIDLTGWTLKAIDGTPSINLEGNISTNSYFLLERTDDNSVPNITADQIYTGALSNSGEHLELKNPNNNIIDEIDGSNDWPAGDNSSKQTMQLVNSKWETGDATPKAENSITPPTAPEGAPENGEETITISGNHPPVADAGNNIIGFINQEISFDGSNSSDPDGDELAYSWNMGDGKLIEEKAFTYQYLYQGTYLVSLMVYDGRNYVSDTITVKIQPQQITINEFIPNPEGKDEENEWIEVYNDSDSAIDISGWQLDDMEEGSKPFVFPENTLIAPKNYLVFPRTITNIALNNTSDSVRLLLPEGIVFQQIDYEDCKEGQSSARTDQGFVWSPPSPGIANVVSPELVEGLGGEEKEFIYQYQVEPETTKESTEDYSWYYNEPEQKIEGGYAILPEKEFSPAKTTKDKLAGAFPLMQQGEVKGGQREMSSKNNLWNQNNLNLILMIVMVVLAGLVIGLLLTKFRKKFP